VALNLLTRAYRLRRKEVEREDYELDSF